MKGLLKKNQIIIYVIAIMLMTAGYLNYTTKQGGDSVETSIEMESKDDTKLADIGDATLVSSNDIVGGDTTDTNTVNTITLNIFLDIFLVSRYSFNFIIHLKKTTVFL